MVSPIQEPAFLGSLATTRSPARDRVMFLVSMKADLRAKAMAVLTWAMVPDAQGQVTEVLHVPNRASKGKTGGRTMTLHPDLHAALVTFVAACRSRCALLVPRERIFTTKERVRQQKNVGTEPS
jgi:integrase/recombinase XerD